MDEKAEPVEPTPEKADTAKEHAASIKKLELTEKKIQVTQVFFGLLLTGVTAFSAAKSHKATEMVKDTHQEVMAVQQQMQSMSAAVEDEAAVVEHSVNLLSNPDETMAAMSFVGLYAKADNDRERQTLVRLALISDRPLILKELASCLATDRESAALMDGGLDHLILDDYRSRLKSSAPDSPEKSDPRAPLVKALSRGQTEGWVRESALLGARQWDHQESIEVDRELHLFSAKSGEVTGIVSPGSVVEYVDEQDGAEVWLKVRASSRP